MKILIKGSMTPPEVLSDTTNAAKLEKNKKDWKEYNTRQPQFVAACKALGTALASREHTILIGVPKWKDFRDGRTVARYVIEGVSKQQSKRGDGSKHRIVFYRPREKEPPDETPDMTDTLQEFASLPNIALNYRYLGQGEGSAAMIPDLEESDAVVLLGGGESTTTIGYMAVSMKKPVVAIKSFEGAAQTIFDDFLFGQYERYIGQGNKMTSNDIQSLECNWSADEDNKDNQVNAQNIVNLTEKLVNVVSGSNRRALSILWITTGYMILFLLVWVALFLRKIVPSTDLAFFLLLFVASILGTGLRTLVSYQQNKIAKLSYVGIGVDLAIALVLAFGLALIYLVGGISFTGTMVILSDMQNSTFASIAVSMSLLGLAAGYLVPLKQIQERLEKIVAPNQAQ